MIWYILTFAMPLIQFGVSWWVNVASVGSVAGILKLHNFPSNLANQSRNTLLAVVGMFVAYLWQSFGDFHSFLRVSREALILILMGYVSSRKIPPGGPNLIRKYKKMLLVVSLFQLALTSFQFVLLQRGRWFGPPEIWFAGRGGLIPTNLDLVYSYIRPSGTFSEPSFLGIFCLAIIVISIPRLDKERILRFVFLANAITILLSQSKSAIFFLFILLIYVFKTFRKYLVQKIPFYFLGGIGLVFLIYNQIITRIQSASSSEVSIDNRIFSPIKFVLKSITDNPLGTDFYGRVYDVLDLNSGLSWETILHNAIYNLIFSYGLFGIVVLVVIFSMFRGIFELRVYLLAVLLQNGSFLDFDKLFLLLVTSVMYQQMRNMKDEQKT